MHLTYAGTSPSAQIRSYPLRSGSQHCSLWRPYLRLRPFAVLAYSRFQPFLDQAMNSLVGDSVLDETYRPFVTQVVEKATYVRIHDPVHSLPLDSHDQRIQRVVRAPPRPESVTETPEILLIDCLRIVTTACCTILSSSAAMPIGLCRPSGFCM